MKTPPPSPLPAGTTALVLLSRASVTPGLASSCPAEKFSAVTRFATAFLSPGDSWLSPASSAVVRSPRPWLSLASTLLRTRSKLIPNAWACDSASFSRFRSRRYATSCSLLSSTTSGSSRAVHSRSTSVAKWNLPYIKKVCITFSVEMKDPTISESLTSRRARPCLPWSASAWIPFSIAASSSMRPAVFSFSSCVPCSEASAWPRTILLVSQQHKGTIPSLKSFGMPGVLARSKQRAACLHISSVSMASSWLDSTVRKQPTKKFMTKARGLLGS
mmetsp:Transcript_2988/g.12086  ORF Transcript_2988/g.12086 Transcript_2988/m.12086 type:complete len:274 (-) Transcript_2988:331-1152(-)